MEDEFQKAVEEEKQRLNKQYVEHLEKNTVKAVQNALADAKQSSEADIARERQKAQHEINKAAQAKEFALAEAKQAAELETEKFRRLAESSRAGEKQLREQMTSLLEELSRANKAKDDAELAAKRELVSREKSIREEAARDASENFNTKIREQEETINKLREQMTAAKLLAEQGSQQLQGEILELDVERNLREWFPADTIEEVKKGERGSDIRQTVNEIYYPNCGLILWECKNAKSYQSAWLGKLKDELAAEKAQIGVIVFAPADGGEDWKQLAENIWLVKPRYAMMLAALLREICARVAVANRNAEGKDVKVEMLYNYLTGGEFANRIRYIIESYDELAVQLDAEKKQAQRRWAAQEKILQKVTGSLYGISGDLHGISGREIIALPAAAEPAE